MRMAATPIFRKGARGILLLFSVVLTKGVGPGRAFRLCKPRRSVFRVLVQDADSLKRFSALSILYLQAMIEPGLQVIPACNPPLLF